MSWALSPDGDPDLGLSIAGQLGPFWSGRHCVAEGRGWLEALIASSGVNHSTEVWANALTALGTLVWEQGDHGRARRILEDSLQACRALDWRLGISQPLRILGLLAMERGDVEQARPFMEECLLLARTRGDEDAIAMSLVQLGDALVVSDRAVARAMYAESLAHYRKTESMEIATVLGSLGRMRLLEGDYAEARALCEDALELRLSGTDARRIADAQKGLADVARCAGDLDAATTLYEQSLPIYRRLGAKPPIADALSGLGFVMVAKGDSSRAVGCFMEGFALREEQSNELGMATCLSGLALAAVNLDAAREAAHALGAVERVVCTWLGIPTTRSEV